MRNVRSCRLFETRQKKYRLRRGRHGREVRQEREKAGAELASICTESNEEQKAEEQITYL